MVKIYDNEENNESEIITDNDTETTEPELSEIENEEENKLKTLRAKLKEAEDKNRELMEELQRSKADFLNGKRRLEEERLRDRDRQRINFIEKLLPLCDSFYLAMLDKEMWAKADPKWRTGVEGIYSQLQSVLNNYQVTSFDPTGQEFDHNKHEALSMIPVEDEAMNNKIISVIQMGYEMKVGEVNELIRPARVTVGEKQK